MSDDVRIYIDFTPEKLKALKKAYKDAYAAGQETFTFEGHELLTAYAGYLIEYLEPAIIHKAMKEGK